MSLQNINPYYIQQKPNYGFVSVPQVQQFVYPQGYNPYQASFYNQNINFPYLPFFQTQQKDYLKLGEIVSPNGEITHLYRLSNGHEVAIMRRKDEQSIVKTFVDAGSMNEVDEKRGVSHVNEHGLFKGSTKLKDGDVFKLTGQMGAYTNASTDYAQINYYISAPYMGEEELKKTIDIQADMIYNPTFDVEAMESEKGPICSEISMINDDPATRAFDKVIRNLFQIQSNSENLVAGSIETVQALTKQDMHNYHQTYYAPENLHTVIIADESIPLETIISHAAKSFKPAYEHNQKIAPRKEVLNPLQVAKREDVRSSKTNSTNVFLAFAGPKPTESKDVIIEKMISYYISQCSTSDLKKNLQDIDATYSCAVQKVGLRENDPYALVSLIETSPNDEQKALDYFYDAIKKLQTQALSDDDMVAIKNNLNKNLEFMMSDSETICDTIGDCMRDNSLDFFADFRKIASSITKEDIMNFARKYYDLNKVSIVVVHPTSVSESDIQRNYQTSKYSLHNVQKAKNISFTGIKNINTDNVKEYQLSNNTHLVLNKTNSNLCFFNWSVNTPPVKPKNPNIPAVLRYMFNKGSEYQNQSELERYKELNGIDLDVFVNGRSIEVSANCMPENSTKTLALINEVMYHPKLTENDFEAAKKYVKSMLLASQKDASSNLLDRLYPGYFPTHERMLQEIDNLRLSDVKEFYNELLKNASSAFVATLPLDKHPNLANEVISHQNMPNIIFKENIRKLTPIFEANPEPNVIYDIDDLNQAQIYQTYKFPMSGNIEDEAKFELLHTILGGSSNARLFSDLREKQNLAYAVSSNIQSFENTGILTLQIQTTTDNKEAGVQSFDNVQKSLDGFKKHVDMLCYELVSDEELASAKMRLKQKIVGQCQNPLSETDLLAMNVLEPYGIKRIDKYVEAIDKITKKDIQDAAKFVFSYNPTTSILASADTINSQMPYLQTLGRVDLANSL
ncbi:MAG: insulinase family protein [Candidatus Gastranaerophilales bacterium]|nr:insulinase family protein [Candidatus Gastranaerophilales bacterium]